KRRRDNVLECSFLVRRRAAAAERRLHREHADESVHDPMRYVAEPTPALDPRDCLLAGALHLARCARVGHLSLHGPHSLPCTSATESNRSLCARATAMQETYQRARRAQPGCAL